MKLSHVPGSKVAGPGGFERASFASALCELILGATPWCSEQKESGLQFIKLLFQMQEVHIQCMQGPDTACLSCIGSWHGSVQHQDCI
jgi:hypothetical protein